jgi:hypothetical protein
MSFILWRPDIGGTHTGEYVTGWAAKGGQASFSNKLDKDTLRYKTRAAADAAIAGRTPREWQVQEIPD